MSEWYRFPPSTHSTCSVRVCSAETLGIQVGCRPLPASGVESVNSLVSPECSASPFQGVVARGLRLWRTVSESAYGDHSHFSA